MPILYSTSGKPYDAHMQWHIFCESQAAWYLTLILCQFWHIWNCRTRSASIYSHGLLSNVVTIYGGATEIAIACAVIYIPAFQKPDAFQTADLRGYFWLPHFVYMFYIFGYNETVKWFARNRPQSFVARNMAW